MKDEGRKFLNLFDLSEEVRRPLIMKAEQAGTSALMWIMGCFDRIGGKGSIRNVFNKFKGISMVKGKKKFD